VIKRARGRFAALLSTVPALCLLGGVPLAVSAAGAVPPVAPDPRMTARQADDELIEGQVLAAVGQRCSGDCHVNATSYDGVVLLTGEVPAEGAKAEVGEIARATPKVRAVQNELVVGAVSDPGSRSDDAVITSKVKAGFVEANKFQGNHVKVVTERGVVYLLGLVRHSEADAATEVARSTSGARRVVRVFEYSPG
jgi:osmotically-inducible protein OsmY